MKRECVRERQSIKVRGGVGWGWISFMICNNLLTFIGHFNMCDLPPPSRPLNGTDLVARVRNPAAFWCSLTQCPPSPPHLSSH